MIYKYEQGLVNRRTYEQGGNTSKGKPNLVLPRESEGEVRRTEDGREYVMYRNEDTGEMVKVFGSWNEAPRVRERDEQGMGRFMAIDTSFNYPVTQNENGEFILDEAMLDTEEDGEGPKMVYDEKFGRKMPVAPVGNLLKQLGQQGPGYSGVDKLSPTVQRGINMRNGGRTYAGQYESGIMEDEGGKYGIYTYDDGTTVKTYFMEDPGEVGEYVPDNDYIFEEMDGKTFARLAEWHESQRNPKERQIGKEVMEESTKGASKVENLLEKLMSSSRGAKTSQSSTKKRTYSY